jgi:hypothetical protein
MRAPAAIALALGALTLACASPVPTGRDPCIDVYANVYQTCARGVHCDADAGQDCSDIIDLQCSIRGCEALANCCAGLSYVSTSCAAGCGF